MRVKMVSGNRDLILEVLQRELGSKAVYTALPEFSYIVGDIKLCRNGYIEITSSDEAQYTADIDVLSSLAKLGLCEILSDDSHSDPDINVDVSIGAGNRTDTSELMNRSVLESVIGSVSEPVTESGSDFAYALNSDDVRFIKNLFCIFSARQLLINNAIDARGAFYISRRLMQDLLDHPPQTIAEYMQFLHGRSGEFAGIAINPDSIVLSGFAKGHPDETQIHKQLADLIVSSAKTRQHIKAFTHNARNRKYAFRTWLYSIGMKGPEYAEARNILLSRLYGKSDRRRMPAGGSAGRRSE